MQKELSIKEYIITLLKHDLVKLCFVFFVWRIALFGVGAFADFALVYAPTFPYADSLLTQYHSPRWLYSWANFDGVHYLTIAEKGYVGTGLIQAFFPFLPYVLLRSLFLLSQGSINTLVVGLFITNAFALALTVVWFYFLKKLVNRRFAWLGAVILLTFPTSLFYGALYTESLFMLTIIGAFWAAKTNRWWLVSILTMIATATRVVGIFLLPALVVEAWLLWQEAQPEKTLRQSLVRQLSLFFRQKWLQLLWIGAGSLGILVYMKFLFDEFRDPLYFLHVQNEFGAGRQEGVVFYPQVVWRSIKILLTLQGSNVRYYTAVLEFLAGTVGLLGLLISAKYVRISYVLFSLGAFFLPTVTGTFSSMPRYILVCFPLYLLLTMALSRYPKIQIIALAISTFFLVVNTVIFIQGYWLS
jgi:hypothetical protein